MLGSAVVGVRIPVVIVIIYYYWLSLLFLNCLLLQKLSLEYNLTVLTFIRGLSWAEKRARPSFLIKKRKYEK